MSRLPTIHDVYGRLNRGHAHIEEFRRQCLIFKDPQSYIIRSQQRDGGRHHDIYVQLRERPPYRDWALLVGDGLHNLRSALDQVVYIAACFIEGKTIPTKDDKLNFPLYGDAAKFDDRKVRHLGPEFAALVEGLQPYNRPQPVPGFMPLFVLHELNNRDKHRLLNFVAAHIHTLTPRIIENATGNSIVRVEQTGSLINHREPAHIATVTLGRPDPGVHVECDLSALVALDEGFSGRNAAFALGQIHTETLHVIQTIAEYLTSKMQD